MNRRCFIGALGGAALALPRLGTAKSRVARVAVLSNQLPTRPPLPVWPAFLEALRQRGWEEGLNLDIQLRATEGIAERRQQLAAELVALQSDVIVAGGSAIIQVMRDRTKTIPSVMFGPGDPLGSGFIASLARPGGNITGLSSQVGDLVGKGFQLHKELRPGLSRIAVFWNPDDPGSKLGAEKQFASGPQYGLALQSTPVKTREDLDAALAALAQNLPEALDVHPSTILAVNVNPIVSFALQHHLPS